MFTGVVLLGFVAIGLGWRVAARTLNVALQVPALVSGGLAGVALVLIGVAFVTIQAERRLAARERACMDSVLDEAAELVAALKDRSAS
jgi:hypothetical protein